VPVFWYYTTNKLREAEFYGRAKHELGLGLGVWRRQRLHGKQPVQLRPDEPAGANVIVGGQPGLGIIGLTQYATRPQPDGPDQTVNLPAVYASNGGIICYPPLAYDPNMTSVTWVLVCGGGLDQMAGSLLFFPFA
jgi:hypothetical protein